MTNPAERLPEPEHPRTPTARYDSTLPPEQVAQTPARSRAESRALYTVRGHDDLDDGHFHELPSRLRGVECLVVIDTRVIPARLRARRCTGGGVVVFLLLP